MEALTRACHNCAQTLEHLATHAEKGELVGLLNGLVELSSVLDKLILGVFMLVHNTCVVEEAEEVINNAQ